MFSVSLPFVSCRELLPLGHSPFQPADSLQGAFVVVIDDDRQSRFAMEATFKAWECHVVSADSAADAVAKLQEHLRSPDLIVSDYRLRDEMNGLQAVRELRAIAEADIPALIVTGDITVADIQQATTEGFMILHKPVSPERLLTTTAQLLETTPAKAG